MSRREVLKYFEEHKDYMNARVAEGIEKYRKGDISISVVDSNGNPLNNVTVEAELSNHEFNFGANIFMLDTLIDYANEPYEDGLFAEGFDISILSNYKERNEMFKEEFCRLLNFATVPFYWNALEPKQGQVRYIKDEPHIYRRPTPADCVRFCKEHGIRMKSHGLAYDGNTPDWLKAIEDPEEVRRLYSKHMQECAELFADDIPDWEVTNETLAVDGAFTDRTKIFLDEDFVEWTFKEAKKYFPHNKLIINDFDGVTVNQFLEKRSWYYMQIREELAKGTPIEGIGLQCHCLFSPEKEEFFSQRYYNPRFLYAIMDRYADFGLPLHITECTVPTYGQDEENEEIQAIILKNLYSIWFSHPAMDGIVYWNIIDGIMPLIGDMSNNNTYNTGGLIRLTDMSKKPSWYAIYDLIHKEWHTHEIQNTGDENSVAFRGFYGDYRVKIKVGDQVIEKTFFAGKNTDNRITLTI